MPGKTWLRAGHQAAPENSWQQSHLPVANTQATATQAAPGAGRRLVCTWLVAVLAAGSTAPTAVNTNVSLIDGDTGGTTYLFRSTISLQATAGVTNGIALSNLWIEGSLNTAMTLEFAAAGGANTFESVSFGGVILDE